MREPQSRMVVHGAQASATVRLLPRFAKAPDLALRKLAVEHYGSRLGSLVLVAHGRGSRRAKIPIPSKFSNCIGPGGGRRIS